MKKPLWAVVNQDLTWHEGRPMIYRQKSSAVFNAYQGYKVIPVEIRPLQGRPKGKRKMK